MTASGNAVVTALDRLRTSLPAGLAWALIGGMAVSARAEPRFTRDVDVAVAARDDRAAEGLTSSLIAAGWSATALVEQEATGRLAQVRFESPGLPGVVCDLLFASSGIEREIAENAELLEVVPGLLVPVARTGHLIVLKLLSVDDHRLQDRLDLQALVQVAAEPDWTTAAAAAALIAERGFARGRDLSSAVTELRGST